MFTDLVIVALAVAFVLSALEQWLTGVWRGLLALALSSLGIAALNHFHGLDRVVLSFATAFAALIAVLVGERLSILPTVVIDPRTRRM